MGMVNKPVTSCLVVYTCRMCNSHIELFIEHHLIWGGSNDGQDVCWLNKYYISFGNDLQMLKQILLVIIRQLQINILLKSDLLMYKNGPNH